MEPYWRLLFERNARAAAGESIALAEVCVVSLRFDAAELDYTLQTSSLDRASSLPD